MQLTKRGLLLVGAPSRAAVIESRFAADPWCWTDVESGRWGDETEAGTDDEGRAIGGELDGTRGLRYRAWCRPPWHDRPLGKERRLEHPSRVVAQRPREQASTTRPQASAKEMSNV
jgi:hypothetical protein